MRSNYWSCSKFADWLRGTAKPHAETSKGWRLWKEAAEETHPIRFWIVEEGLDYAQNFIYWPIDKLYSIKYYINNRWVTRTHSLTAHPRDIKPGDWCDVGNRFLPCLFNELVDFVEIESAWSHIAWGSKEDRAKYDPPFWASGWFRWRTWRCPQAGLDHLDWAMTLTSGEDWGLKPDDENFGKPTHQAIKAKELLDLYTWWTVERPKRPDPHEASGWSAICDRRREGKTDFFDFEDRTEEEEQETKKALDLCQEIEQRYEQEDEDMMIRLIKIRQGLWT
jgi:hypothetical protein